MFIRPASARPARLRTSAVFAATVAMVLQLFAAGGLACSTMSMDGHGAETGGSQVHDGSQVQDGSKRHAHGAPSTTHGAPSTTRAHADHGSEHLPQDNSAQEDGACAMMMHCTAPGVARVPTALQARVVVKAEGRFLTAASLTSAPQRISVPPPKL